MTTDTIEDLDALPLDQVEARLASAYTAFKAADEAGDAQAMAEHLRTARKLAERRSALTASAAPAAQPATVASAAPAVTMIVAPSTAVTPPDTERVDRVDTGWSERCAGCRQSYHDPKVKMVRVRASGIKIKLCPRCRSRHPGLLPA